MDLKFPHKYVSFLLLEKYHIPIFLSAESQSQFHHDSLVFHIGEEYFTSRSTFRATILLTNI